MQVYVIGRPKPVKPSEYEDGTWFASLSNGTNYIAVKMGIHLVMVDGSNFPVVMADEDMDWSLVTMLTASV